MAKFTATDLTDLSLPSAVTALNNNFAAIETAMEKTLSRDGTTPNTMTALLDMNSNRIINLPDPEDNDEAVSRGFLEDYVSLLLTNSATAGLPNFTHNSVNSHSQTLVDKARQRVDVIDFVPEEYRAAILNGTSTVDMATYIAYAWAYVTSFKPYMPDMVFSPGRWNYSVAPNFAVQTARVYGAPGTRLRFTGSGDALTLDGGTSANGVNDVTFGPFIIEAPASAAGHGLVLKNINRSMIDRVNVRGCGAAKYAIRAIGCVCTTFINPMSSPLSEVDADGNGGFYALAVPLIGLFFGDFSVSQKSSFCTVIAPRMEYATYGIYFANSLSNVIIGGTSEGNTNTGCYFDTGSIDNTVFKTDFESNTTYDVLLQGTRNRLIDCYSVNSTIVVSGSSNCAISGGSYNAIQIASGALDTVIGPVTYNAFGLGGAYTDSGTRTVMAGAIFNFGTKVSVFGSDPSTPHSSTVANLPAAASVRVGSRAFVTDASATTFNSVVAGGGANTVPVVNSGTNWLIG